MLRNFSENNNSYLGGGPNFYIYILYTKENNVNIMFVTDDDSSEVIFVSSKG